MVLLRLSFFQLLIYNVGEAEALTMADWVGQIGQAVGWSGEIVIVPKDRLPVHLTLPYNTNQHLVADTTRIRTQLGYSEPVPPDEALSRTIAWERAHPPTQIDPGKFDYATEDEFLTEWKRRGS
jgi:nucleoside-diphosphate-sugar epimerase